MGVTTVGYSISPQQMRKLKTDETNFNFILGFDEETYPQWELLEHDFGRNIEQTIKILKASGYRKTAQKFDYESVNNQQEYEGAEIWVITPKSVTAMAKELNPANFEQLKTKGLSDEITDYDGKIITEDDYGYFIGDIDTIKTFLTTIAEQGHFLVLVTM